MPRASGRQRERTTQSIPHSVGTRHPVARAIAGREGGARRRYVAVVRKSRGVRACAPASSLKRAVRSVNSWSAVLCLVPPLDKLLLLLLRRSYYFFAHRVFARARVRAYFWSARRLRAYTFSVFLHRSVFLPPPRVLLRPRSCRVFCAFYHRRCIIIGRARNWHARARAKSDPPEWTAPADRKSPAEFFPSRSCRTARVRRSNRWRPSPPPPPPQPRWWRPEAACNPRRTTWWRRRTADNSSSSSSSRTWPSPRTTANRIRKKRNSRRPRPTCTAGAARPAAINSRPLRTSWSTGWAVSCAAPCAWTCRERPSTRWARPDAPVLPFARPAVIVVVAHQLTDTPPSLPPPPLPPPPPPPPLPLGQRHRWSHNNINNEFRAREFTFVDTPQRSVSPFRFSFFSLPPSLPPFDLRIVHGGGPSVAAAFAREISHAERPLRLAVAFSPIKCYFRHPANTAAPHRSVG